MIEDKIRYLVSKHPEVKPCFRCDKSKFLSMSKKGYPDKDVFITDDPEEWRWHLLFHLIKNPRQSVRIVGMYEVLEIAMGKVEDVVSLSSIKADILLIKDGEYRSMSHEQKEVFLQVLFDNSPIVIYEWLGSYQSFCARSRLPEYLRPKTSKKVDSPKEELF